MANSKKDQVKTSPDDIIYDSQGKKWTRGKLEAYREYQNAFMKETYQSIVFRMNKNSEADIIEFLKSHDNIAGYIKQLIRNDMEGTSNLDNQPGLIADEIGKLAALLDKQLITKSEFNTLKKRLINPQEDKK